MYDGVIECKSIDMLVRLSVYNHFRLFSGSTTINQLKLSYLLVTHQSGSSV